MSCSGLHCAGCGAGLGAPVLGLAAVLGVDWVITNIVEVVIVAGTCGALAVAAVVALMRLGERRDARQRAAASIWTVRADALPPRAGRPAAGYRELHIHLGGQTAAEQAHVIRQALEGNRP